MSTAIIFMIILFCVECAIFVPVCFSCVGVKNCKVVFLSGVGIFLASDILFFIVYLLQTYCSIYF